jgi:carboxypeptidase PM20D1
MSHPAPVSFVSRRTAVVVGAAAIALAVILAVRPNPAPLVSLPGAAPVEADTARFDGAPERLAAALRIATISHSDPAQFDSAAFGALHAHLARAFPLAHAALTREFVATHSVLYTWHGSDASLKPVLLVAHLDVVPVEAAAAATWTHEPFSGAVVDGHIWGRGAIDNKSAVLGILEAVESLVASGFVPTRTVMLAFGHDEEVGGSAGARAIAALLAARGTALELVLDEGGVIGDGVIPGVTVPTALVGVAEKGFASVELVARTAGGHSSLPPRESSVGVLGAAVLRLEASQMPARLAGPARMMFERLGPRFPALRRALFANLWLTEPLVVRALQRAPSTNAMVRTTTAVTIFQAGTKDNVLPAEARAVLNYRILPGDHVADVHAHVRDIVDDPRIEVRAAGAFEAEPSAVSDVSSMGFQAIERSLLAVAPDAVVSPFLVVVVTDARHYAALSQNVFRFLPIRLSSSDLARIHGVDERLAVGEYVRAIRFYRHFIQYTTR